MQWWMELMPPDIRNEAAEIAYQGKKRAVALPARLQEESPAAGDGTEAGGAGRQVEIDTDTEETDADFTVHAGAHGHTETMVEVIAPEALPDRSL